MNARNVLRALLLCAAAFCVPLSAAEAPLKIGIVGTGNIGGALATHWAKAGHELVISSRHPEELQALAKSLGPKVRVGTPSEAAKFGDVILLSVPYKATPQVGRDLANDWKGKILLDTGNPYPFRDGEMATDARKRGTGVTSKEFLPGVRLVRDAGFDPVVVGGLARAREFDVGSKVYTELLTAPQLREQLGLK